MLGLLILVLSTLVVYTGTLDQSTLAVSLYAVVAHVIQSHKSTKPFSSSISSLQEASKSIRMLQIASQF